MHLNPECIGIPKITCSGVKNSKHLPCFFIKKLSLLPALFSPPSLIYNYSMPKENSNTANSDNHMNILKDSGSKKPANPLDNSFINSFQMLVDNKELMFQVLDMFPIPVEIFDAKGTTVYMNRAGKEWIGIKDVDLLVGKYNVLRDPVMEQMGLMPGIQRAFRGETVVTYDVVPPIEDVQARGVIDEKPFEKAFTDFHLYPVMNGKKVAFVVFVCVVKKMYQGKPEVAKVKEYMDTHWQGEYDSHAAAKSVHMSVTQLYSLFKQHTGMTPGEYHNKVKVDHIKEKLEDKSLSIKEAFAA